jgi:hypothetical protein
MCRDFLYTNFVYFEITRDVVPILWKTKQILCKVYLKVASMMRSRYSSNCSNVRRSSVYTKDMKGRILRFLISNNLAPYPPPLSGYINQNLPASCREERLGGNMVDMSDGGSGDSEPNTLR